MQAMRYKELLIICAICIIAVVSSALLKGSPAVEATEEDSQTIESIPRVQLELKRQLIAENEHYRLFMDEVIGHVFIEHKSNGYTWYTSPPIADDLPPNIIKTVRNPVTIRYTEGGTSFSQTNPIDEEAIITASMIDDGVRFEYDMEASGLVLAVEYRLQEDGFDVTIPFQSVKETGRKRIVSIEPIPYFEAASPESEGALFMPDGSGAIMEFKTVRPVYFESFNEFIYGGDHAFKKNIYQRVTNLTMENTVKQPSELVALPVFGLYKDGKGFLGIVTQGDADAMIRSIPAGVRNVDLYRTSVNFIYRNDDITFIGSSGEIAMIERSLIAGDRSVRFLLQSDEAANYVGMAQSYRQYLIDEHGLQKHNAEPRMHLRLFGGAQRQNVIGNTFISMTTFDQAREIIDRLLEDGLSSIEVTLTGWSHGGQYGNQPKHFPAARSLGGNQALEKLAAYLASRDVPLYLSANYVKAYSESKALKYKKDAIYGINKDVVATPLPFRDTRQMSGAVFYYLKPERVFARYINKEAEQYHHLGIAGLHLEWMGEAIYSDHQHSKPFRRADTINTWQETLDLMRQQTGQAVVDYGFAYALGHVDRIDHIPLDSSHYYYQDRAVPFYQIAIHGLLPYTAKPSNLADDPRLHLLKILEYGALPSYELTYESSTDLKETLANHLFSSAYEDWLQYAADDYERLMDILLLVHDQFISDHEMLAPHVYRTTYEDGTQIIVNYDFEAKQVAGYDLEPYGYLIMTGEEVR